MQYREPELGGINTGSKNIIDTNGKAGKGSKTYYVSAKDEQIGVSEPELGGNMNTGSDNMNTGSDNMNTGSESVKTGSENMNTRSENTNTGSENKSTWLEDITNIGSSTMAGVALITTFLSFLLFLR